MAQTVAFNESDVVTFSVEVDRSYAHCVLGAYIDRPRRGSVWLSSLADQHNDPALSAFQKKARILETAVIPLAVEKKQIDYLEIHFGRPLDAQARLALETLADALSRIWVGRSPGLFSEAILTKQKQTECTSPMQGRLLSIANPACLSRAEFRICLLLSRGLNRRSICEEVSISPATFRTHLRSILRKVGVGTLPELLFVLLASSRPEGPSVRDAVWIA